MRWLAAALLALLLAFQYRLWVGDGSFSDIRRLRDEISVQEKEIERLVRRNQTLEAEVEDLREGLDALEERARSELGMIKRGELFLQIIEGPALGTAGDTGGKAELAEKRGDTRNGPPKPEP